MWNSQYSEWFFVNIYTKQSQWDKPTEPAYPAGEGPPHGPPPGYASGAVGSHATGTSEKAGFGSNNPYANMSEDEKLARKLQEEEDARAGRHSGDQRGQANDYYTHPGQSQYGGYPQQSAYPQQGGYPQQSASPYPQAQSGYEDSHAQEKGKSKGGLLGKILGKATGSSSSHSYPQQQHGYGQPAYGGAPAGYYGGGYQQGPMGMGGGMMGGGRRPGGGGIGAGGLALGAGAGLLGGAMLGSAMGDAGDGGNYGKPISPPIYTSAFVVES